ncbi:MAG: aminotransferase class V-fold PLP-dependent enzyme [Candidatus Hydrogenedens sp.]|nr:aminotransferase class V-fold PLP-dependent enzyme [Candidatus Hydrogenedens sp.]
MTDPLELIKALFPYQEDYGCLTGMPETGIDHKALLEQIRDMSTKEDQCWENGRCSGTAYCGDHEHYDLLNQVFSAFSHVNALQRDMCPSMNRFESEIVAMTLDMLHGEAVAEHGQGHKACGSLGFGGTESILNAMLVYREKAKQERGITEPEMILPTTGHPAFNKAAHLFGIKVVPAPIVESTTLVDLDFVRDHINANTAVIVGSAGNYPYGTIDPIDELSSMALEHGVGLHVDGCLGGFILPWGEKLGYDIPVFDFRLPGVTSISACSHKFGYGLKGTSVVCYRDRSYRQYQYFMQPEWSGGSYASPGIAGSRSGGVIAATWAAMVTLGKEGYLERARKIFESSFAMQRVVTSHEPLFLHGSPTFCFAFSSRDFNVYHINDFMRERGWRFNGIQHPDALHFCVTGPSAHPEITAAFEKDLAEAVAYAKNPPQPEPLSSAFYGGAGMRIEDPDVMRFFLMAGMDAFYDNPIADLTSA